MIDGWTIIGIIAFVGTALALAMWLEPKPGPSRPKGRSGKRDLQRIADEEQVHTRNQM